jgi:hypothetical protein
LPDAGALVYYLGGVIPDAARRHAALVENPARLSGF